MIWWILTYLDNYRPPHSLTVLAETNMHAHLFMKWSRFKPSRRPIYKRVRAVNVWCGYEYIWDTPHLVEQAQPGNTFEHLFGPIPLATIDHVWYYLFSIGERPFKECQGPLIHVPPPELPMPAARIFNSADQPCAINNLVIVQFDSVLYDDYGLFDIAQPDRFTIPAGALYAFGANVSLGIAASGKAYLAILLNAGAAVVRHDHLIEDTGWAGATITLNCQLALKPTDFLQVEIYYTGVGARDIMAYPNFSPHFWIAQIGSYPVSPP